MEENLTIFRKTPFEWGEHDCALFASEHVKALTEVDIGSDYRGKYSNALGALKTLKENGYDNLLELCQDNFLEIHLSQARSGDLAIIEEDGYALAVVLGETIGVLTPNGYGIIRRSDKRIKTGFKIG